MLQLPHPTRLQNSAGGLPDEPKFAGQTSIWYRRRDFVLRRYFSRPIAVRLVYFPRLVGFFEAMADIRGAKSLIQ